MGICLSNQIKAESPFPTGVISSKNVSGNGTELSNPSSKDSSTSTLPTTWSEGVISSKNVSGNGTELSNPSSKASSASVPQIPRSEGANSSKNVSGNGTELSNPSSKASSASVPQIPRSEGANSSKIVSGNGTEPSNPNSKASSSSTTQISRSEGFFSAVEGICLSNQIKAESPLNTGVISSEYVHGKGCELSNSSSKAASASVPPIPRSDGEILQSSNLKSFKFSDLKAATKNFCRDHALGEGGFGSVFKGCVDEHSLAASKPGDGMVIAVKSLNKKGWQGHKEWLVEINYLGQLHHPNLVNLIGYCMEDDHRLLVYEFMPNGSMDNQLFRRGSSFQPLSWNQRMKIALGAARGLAFLHNAKVIHRDFKTSNILLDSNYNAKLSDFGLARDGPIGDKSHVTTQVMGTFGYTAPEYHSTGHLTAKCDVYSFGVVLLEILSGRRAISWRQPKEERNLVLWAKPYLMNKRRMLHILDPCLEEHYSTGQALKAAILACGCLIEEPKSRPNMDDVVIALEHVQESK